MREIQHSEQQHDTHERTRLPKLVAHRGSTGPGAPENTMPAFHAAVALGADFIETDIRRTRDGVLVLHHDPIVGASKLCDLTFAEAYAATSHQGAPLARLDDLLPFAKGRIGLNLELKEAGDAEQLATLLRPHAFELSQLVVTSFLETALLDFGDCCPAPARGLLLEERSSPRDEFPEERLRATRADFAVAHESLLHRDFARRLACAGFPIWVWTVNDAARLATLLREPGVDAIITDRVRLASTVRSRLPPQ